MTTESLVPIIDALARGDSAFVATLVSRCGGLLAASVLRAGVQPGVAGAPPIDTLVQEVALAVAELAPIAGERETPTDLVDRAAELVTERGFAPERTGSGSGPVVAASRQLSLFSSGQPLHLSTDSLRAALDDDLEVPADTAACSAA